MPRPSTLVLRRLTAKRKITLKGRVVYADNTPQGTIIDPHDDFDRRVNPFTLERFVPPRPGPINHLAVGVWEVVECYSDIDRAVKRVQKAKKEDPFKGAVLRIRDRRNGSYFMCDIL